MVIQNTLFDSEVVRKKADLLLRNQMAHSIDKARSDRPYFKTKSKYSVTEETKPKKNQNTMFAYK